MFVKTIGPVHGFLKAGKGLVSSLVSSLETFFTPQNMCGRSFDLVPELCFLQLRDRYYSVPALYEWMIHEWMRL